MSLVRDHARFLNWERIISALQLLRIRTRGLIWFRINSKTANPSTLVCLHGRHNVPTVRPSAAYTQRHTKKGTYTSMTRARLKPADSHRPVSSSDQKTNKSELCFLLNVQAGRHLLTGRAFQRYESDYSYQAPRQNFQLRVIQRNPPSLGVLRSVEW